MNCNNIKEYRTKLNLTQLDLAFITGLSNGYLSHLENGGKTNPSFSTMKKIANALNCSITDIFE